jgi:Reverse transcriptase (RNA-dependent DNA polymerase)
MVKISDDEIMVKPDLSNAFNCLRRDIMLKIVAEELPFIYRFSYLAYGNGTIGPTLGFGNEIICSPEGVQQGDPQGPLLFYVTVQPLLRSLSSQMIVAFMDDVTLGGQPSSVAESDDVATMSTQGLKYGLQLNFNK